MNAQTLFAKTALRAPFLTFLTLILGFSGAIFNGVSATLIVPVILSFLGQDINIKGAPPVLSKILNFFDSFPEETRLALLTGVVVTAIALKNLASYGSTLASTALSRRITKNLRLEGMRILLDVDLDFYSNVKVGDLVNRIGEQTTRTASAIKLVTNIIGTSITFLVFVGLLLSISWRLTIASTVLLFLVAGINQYFVWRAKSFGKLLSQVSGKSSAALIEALNGIRLIKVTGSEEAEYLKTKQLIEEREKLDFQSACNFAAIGPINEITGIVTVLTIVVLGRLFFADKLASFSTVLLTYLFVLFRALPLLSQLSGSRSQLANNAASVEVVTDLLRRDNKPFMKNGTEPYHGFQKEIRFEDLSFAYPGHSDLALKQVNVTLPRGTTLALVGSSGAGKSTLADLLPRFYDPVEGRITIDGRDLRDYEYRSLRRAMGIVSQDTFLFNDTVRNNIAYGCPEATEDDIILAAKRANAYEFIERLPQGIDTLIGDRGVLLSGGQRQRLAIARALLRNPQILILDEATSALDTASERLVQQAIEELSRDRTILVIAHRLSTIQKANQIAVLDKGQVVEVGNHEELLKKKGYYTKLYMLQFSEDAQEIIKAAQTSTLIKTSFEIRARLNSMIGSLKLIVDGMTDTQEEQVELIEESYYSAVNILKTLELLEESTRA